MKLVSRVPLDDDMLWLIGDGPLSELQMQRGGSKRIEELAQSNEKLARILHLVREIP